MVVSSLGMAYISFQNDKYMADESEIQEKTNNNQESPIKILTSAIPFVTILIIILGLIKLFLYYYNFHLPIKYFFGVTELGLIISGDLILFNVIIIGTIVTTQIIFKSLKTIDNDFSSKSITPLIFKILFYAGLGLAIYRLVKSVIDKNYPNFLSSICLLIIIVIGLLFIYFRNRMPNTQKTRVNLMILLYTISMLTFIVIFTANDIKAVEKGQYKGTKIYTTDSTYTSTDSSYFIGKTEKYVFIYNVKDKKTRIIPSESVKMIDMQSK